MPAHYRYPVKAVTVAGRIFPIVYDAALKDDWAEFRHDDGVIAMGDAVRTAKQFHETLRHELIHIALAMGGPTHMLSNEIEETVVRCLENLLFPALDAFDVAMADHL